MRKKAAASTPVSLRQRMRPVEDPGDFEHSRVIQCNPHGFVTKTVDLGSQVETVKLPLFGDYLNTLFIGQLLSVLKLTLDAAALGFRQCLPLVVDNLDVVLG